MMLPIKKHGSINKEECYRQTEMDFLVNTAPKWKCTEVEVYRSHKYDKLK